MNPTTNGEAVNPARTCERCEATYRGNPAAHEGDLICPACWAEVRAAEHREAIEECDAELEGLEATLDLAGREYEAEVRRLKSAIKAWARRRQAEERKLLELRRAAP